TVWIPRLLDGLRWSLEIFSPWTPTRRIGKPGLVAAFVFSFEPRYGVATGMADVCAGCRPGHDPIFALPIVARIALHDLYPGELGLVGIYDVRLAGGGTDLHTATESAVAPVPLRIPGPCSHDGRYGFARPVAVTLPGCRPGRFRDRVCGLGAIGGRLILGAHPSSRNITGSRPVS